MGWNLRTYDDQGRVVPRRESDGQSTSRADGKDSRHLNDETGAIAGKEFIPLPLVYGALPRLDRHDVTHGQSFEETWTFSNPLGGCSRDPRGGSSALVKPAWITIAPVLFPPKALSGQIGLVAQSGACYGVYRWG
jgi:hypothetical protein